MSNTEENKNFRKDLTSFLVDKINNDMKDISFETNSLHNDLSIIIEDDEEYASEFFIRVDISGMVTLFQFREHTRLYRNDWILSSENSIDLVTGENWNKLSDACIKAINKYKKKLKKIKENEYNKHFANEKIKTYLRKYKISKI